MRIQTCITNEMIDKLMGGISSKLSFVIKNMYTYTLTFVVYLVLVYRCVEIMMLDV